MLKVSLNHKQIEPVFILALAALVYTLPIFFNLTYWGIQDWDQHLFYHAVPRLTLLEFGQFPLWNPYYVGGTVMLANPQSRFLSPTFGFTLLFGEVVGLKIEIWLHLFIGLTGMYVLARHYRLNRVAAILAACVFMLNSMYALNLAVGMTWFLAVAYLPWAFLFFLKGLNHWPYALASGLCLVLMFFGGGAYPLPITWLFFGFYGLLLVLFKEFRLARVVKILLVILAFTLCLGAVKFLPTFEFLRQHPRFIYDYSGYSLNALQVALFSRNQTLTAITQLPISEQGFINGVTGGMDENGMYIGLVPLALALLGLTRLDKPRLLLLVTFLFFLWLSFGNRIRPELWSWLHLLPVYNSMRVAQRFRIIFIACLALLAGFGFHTFGQLTRQKINNPVLARFSSFALLGLVLADLLAVSVPVLKDAFTIPPLPVNPAAAFYQIWEQPSYDQNGWIMSTPVDASNPFAAYSPFGIYSTYGSLYPTLLANMGTINGYETANVPRAAIPASSPDYHGEVYLAGAAGTARFGYWSPNRVVIDVQAAGPGRVVLNQNYYSGWRVNPARDVENFNGLLTVPVSPEDRQIELYYRPTSFVIGLVVTLTTSLLTIIALVWTYRGRFLPV